MAPPPLPLFSPSLKAPPPPPWLHGSSTQSRDSAPPVPPLPAEATPSKFRIDSPKPAPARKNTKTAAKPLTAGVPGGRTHRAVLGIIRRVRSLELSDAPSPNSVHTSNSGAAAAAFHLTIELSPPREPGQYVVEKEKSRAVPWAAARDEGLKVALRREKKPREPTRAETELETHELHRLRRLARGIGRWARAKKAGVTDEVVKEVRREWASGEELAAVRIVEPLRRSMDRAREILEIKTGGLVVWTKGDMHFVYRGSKYQQNAKHSHTFLTNVHKDDAFQENDQSICGQKDEEPVKGTLYEREVNRLLDTLGPRFVDWWWDTPLPVDADLLPEFVPGFKTPYRLCPPGVRPTLADEELTYLRKLARLLPTHFALGRNTRLQGLAAAILKLWEKSLIAKIAVKIGIQNTNNEQMAWNLKHLTGGTVILRNKDFIILYRGEGRGSPTESS
uniref:CRM domain-containing protein n=1 Tax=Zea mays TaxID=4577 RepID=A0A804LX59_MAIZE